MKRVLSETVLPLLLVAVMLAVPTALCVWCTGRPT